MISISHRINYKCGNTSVSVHSEASFASPWTETVPTKKEISVPKVTPSNSTWTSHVLPETSFMIKFYLATMIRSRFRGVQMRFSNRIILYQESSMVVVSSCCDIGTLHKVDSLMKKED